MLITSRENPQIKLAVRLRESAKARREHGLFFLEGYRLCNDALEHGFAPQALYCTETALLKYKPQHENITLISDHVTQKLADTQTPQGVFGVFNVNHPTPTGHPSAEGNYLALENLQDPANLGAIARTAEALGLDGLVVSGGCDIYHPKALRAGMGALLRLPVMQADDLPCFLRTSDLPSFAAVLSEDATPLPLCDFSAGCVIAIGNEGNGLSREAIQACKQKLMIPMAGKAESLNAAAAAAIIMWEAVSR